MSLEDANNLLNLATVVNSRKTKKFSMKVKEVEKTYGSEETTVDYLVSLYDSQTGEEVASYNVLENVEKRDDYPTDFENNDRLWRVREMLTGSIKGSVAEKFCEDYQNDRAISARDELRLVSWILNFMVVVDPRIRGAEGKGREIADIKGSPLDIETAKKAYDEVRHKYITLEK